jgi:hypothetical protein
MLYGMSFCSSSSSSWTANLYAGSGAAAETRASKGRSTVLVVLAPIGLLARGVLIVVESSVGLGAAG